MEKNLRNLNFNGLKMHSQNIVDGICFQKEFFKKIFVK
jgi:hypothetical protein